MQVDKQELLHPVFTPFYLGFTLSRPSDEALFDFIRFCSPQITSMLTSRIEAFNYYRSSKGLPEVSVESLEKSYQEFSEGVDILLNKDQ